MGSPTNLQPPREETEEPPLRDPRSARKYRTVHLLFAWLNLLLFIGGVVLVLLLEVTVEGDLYLARTDTNTSEHVTGQLGTVHAEWMLVSAPAVSVVVNALIGFSSNSHHMASPWRGVDSAISSAMVLFALCVFSRIWDVVSLLLFCVAQALASLLGAVIAENSYGVPAWSAFLYSATLHTGVSVAIAMALLQTTGTFMYGTYAIVATHVFFTAQDILVRWLQLSRCLRADTADYLYLIISITSKCAAILGVLLSETGTASDGVHRGSILWWGIISGSSVAVAILILAPLVCIIGCQFRSRG